MQAEAARLRLGERYDAANRQAALLILADASRNSEESLQVQWARLWLERHDGYLMTRGAA